MVTRAQQEPLTLEKICLETTVQRNLTSAGCGNRNTSCYYLEAVKSLTTAFPGGEEQVRHSTGTATLKRLDEKLEWWEAKVSTLCCETGLCDLTPPQDRHALAELEWADPQPDDIFADLCHLRNKKEMINA